MEMGPKIRQKMVGWGVDWKSDAGSDHNSMPAPLWQRLPPDLIAHKSDGTSIEIPLKVRIDTPAEVDYYTSGGILPYVLNQILAEAK